MDEKGSFNTRDGESEGKGKYPKGRKSKEH